MNQVHTKTVSRFFFTLLAVISLPLSAQESGEDLVSQKMCYACHNAATASIGPPWQAIAARHSVRSDVMEDVLAVKIIHGGGGNWGVIPMVPNQRVSKEEAKVMAIWILQQRP